MAYPRRYPSRRPASRGSGQPVIHVHIDGGGRSGRSRSAPSRGGYGRRYR
jgi:hypothetical protein